MRDNTLHRGEPHSRVISCVVSAVAGRNGRSPSMEKLWLLQPNWNGKLGHWVQLGVQTVGCSPVVRASHP